MGTEQKKKYQTPLEQRKRRIENDVDLSTGGNGLRPFKTWQPGEMWRRNLDTISGERHTHGGSARLDPDTWRRSDEN